MVSKSHKFIIITPQKTGATSMTKALLNLCDISEENVIPQFRECFEINDPFREKHSKHCTIREICKTWDSVCPEEDFDEYYKIGSIRNPWDRMLSWYMWSNNGNPHGNIEKFKHFINNVKMLGLCQSFEYGGKMMIDDFIRFPTLAEDFHSFCDKIGEDIKLPKLNVGVDRESYQPYYTKETADMVAIRYARDLKYFGYTFD